MELLRLAVRRLVAQRSLAAMMVVAFAFTAGVLVAGPVYSAGAEQAVVFGSIQRASPLAKDVIVDLLSPPGFDAARAGVGLRGALRPLPISRVVFQEASNPIRVTVAGGSSLAPLAYRDGVIGQVAVVQGRAPSADDEVLLPESTAASLLVGPGARLSLTSSSTAVVRVAGIYSSAAGTDPLLFSPDRLLPPPGPTATNALPLLTTSSGFEAITRAFGQTEGIRMEWDAEPDLRGATVEDLRRLAAEASRVPPGIRAAVGGASVTADLGSLVPGAQRAVTDSLAPMYLVSLEVAMVGLAVLAGVGSLKLRRQSFELAVLKTRGARTQLLLAVEAAEAALAAAVGFPLALALGLGLGLVARAAHGPGSPGAPFEISLNPRAVLVGTIGVVLGAVVLVLISVPHLRRSVLQERREASREQRPVWLRFPSEVVPLALAAIALAELRRRGISPSNGSLDPLILVAPTLGILGGGIAAVRLLFWGFRRTEPVAERIGSPSSYLAVHHLPRTTANMSLALLLVLSMGLFAFSSSLRRTVLTGDVNTARGQIGADWNFLVGTPTQGARSAAALPVGATLVFHGSVATSSESSLAEATLIGLDPPSYASGGWWRERDADLPLTTLLDRLTPPPIGLALPRGTNQVQIPTADPLPPGTELVATLEDSNGGIAARELELDGAGRYQASAAGAARLLSILVSAAVPDTAAQKGFDLTLGPLILTGSSPPVTVPISTWRGLDTGGQTVTTTPSGGDSIRARFAATTGGPIGGIAPTDAPLPALIGQTASGPVPATAVIRVGYLGLPLRVVGTLRAFPAIRSDAALIVVPVRAVTERFGQILRTPNGGAFSVLAMGADDPTPAVRGAGLQVIATSRAATIESLLGSSPQNLALGMEFAAGLAGAVLATLALGLALYFGARRRRYEFSSLRALGGRATHAAATLAIEYGLLLVPVLVVGYGIGIALLAVVLPHVASGSATRAPTLLVDRGAMLAAALASAATLAVGLAATAARLAGGSAAAVLRGEPE
jgi:hypothetical protein